MGAAASPIVLAALLLAAPAFGQGTDTNGRIDAVLGDHTAYQKVILEARAAVAVHDASAVAALVRYPIAVTIDGRKRIIRAPRAFVAHYSGIVTPGIARAILSSRYESLFVNWQGVMFGHGEMWITGVCRDRTCKQVDVKIGAIQPPAGLRPQPR